MNQVHTYTHLYVVLAFANLALSDNDELIEFQAAMEKVVNRVWTDLSSFEESAANCISDLLLNVAAGSYNETIRIARQFIMHLEVLFNAIDFIEMHLVKHQQSKKKKSFGILTNLFYIYRHKLFKGS